MLWCARHSAAQEHSWWDKEVWVHHPQTGSQCYPKVQKAQTGQNHMLCSFFRKRQLLIAREIQFWTFSRVWIFGLRDRRLWRVPEPYCNSRNSDSSKVRRHYGLFKAKQKLSEYEGVDESYQWPFAHRFYLRAMQHFLSNHPRESD